MRKLTRAAWNVLEVGRFAAAWADLPAGRAAADDRRPSSEERMNPRPTTTEIPVLIAGGGPIGLALAADLGRRGIATLLVEERDDKLAPAKMLEVSVRTMEFCRGLGIAEKVRNW